VRRRRLSLANASRRRLDALPPSLNVVANPSARAVCEAVIDPWQRDARARTPYAKRSLIRLSACTRQGLARCGHAPFQCSQSGTKRLSGSAQGR
jgi:hypothetical protein